MHIQVTVTYAMTDQPTMSTQEIADAMFSAMGADEEVDTCSVLVNQSGQKGSSLTPPVTMASPVEEADPGPDLNTS